MQEEQTSAGLDLATAVLLAALVFGLFRQGAYHEGQHLVFGVLVGAAGLLHLSTTAGRASLARALIVVLPVALVSVLSASLAVDSANAASTLVTIALVAIGLSVGAGVPSHARLLVIDLLLAATAIVAVTAIHGVATHTGPWGRVTGDVWRGSSSVTYANAAAAVLSMALVLAGWRAMRSDSRVHAAFAALSMIALVSTQSRAAFVSLVLVIPLVVFRAGLDSFVRTAGPILLGAALGSSTLVALAPVDASARPALTWLVVTAGCAVSWTTWSMRRRLRRPVRWAVAGGTVAAAVALASPLRERLTLRSATTATGPDGSVAFGDRGNLWSSAWDRVLERPIAGHGPGNVDLRWTESGREFTAIFVHNEYLELLVTHGVIGLIGFTASVALAGRAGRSRASNGALAAAALFLVHSAFDFLWHIPVLPVMAAVLVGLSQTWAGVAVLDGRSNSEPRATMDV